MAVITRKFELKEGVDNLTLTLNSGEKPKTISKWPYETKNPDEIRALKNSRSLVEGEPETKATPAAIRKAEELGVSIEEVEPTGSDDNVTVDDVEKQVDNT